MAEAKFRHMIGDYQQRLADAELQAVTAAADLDEATQRIRALEAAAASPTTDAEPSGA